MRDIQTETAAMPKDLKVVNRMKILNALYALMAAPLGSNALQRMLTQIHLLWSNLSFSEKLSLSKDIPSRDSSIVLNFSTRLSTAK